ncbi:T9SS type A sorting domain-containing protein [Bacteroidales bacterium OttesenSCG-928-I21]|nr:T9SS type A sorting domain-containing protein [Bacteroidales bacterium OttesenSCG-928-I21]
MKRIFLLVIGVMFFLTNYAQTISLDRTDYFEVGNLIPRISFEFSPAVEINEIITEPVVFSAPSFEGQMSTLEIEAGNTTVVANIAYISDDFGGLTQLYVDDNKSEVIGFFINMMDLVERDVFLDEPLTLYNFPIEYNDAHSDIKSGVAKVHLSELEEVLNNIDEELYTILTVVMQFDSVKLALDVEIHSEFDEFGEMELEGSDVLEGAFQYIREKRNVIINKDLFFRNSTSGEYQSFADALQMDMFPIIDSMFSYSYWTKNHSYPLVEINLDNSYSVVDKLTLRYDDGVGIKCPEKLTMLSCLSYPNPVKDIINFNIEKYSNCKLQIYSVVGNLVMEIPQNSTTTSINISDFESGIYFYRAIDENGTSVAGGKFVKE